MSVMNSPRLRWQRQRRIADPRVIAVAALLLIAAMAVIHWKNKLDADLTRRQDQLQRVESLLAAAHVQSPVQQPELGHDGARQLGEQFALLNKDWPRLLNAIVPNKRQVKLLSVDVNPDTAAIRVTGRAPDLMNANDYAQWLETAGSPIGDVRVIVFERRPDGIYFEIGAKWNG
jgi:hypothetical protein